LVFLLQRYSGARHVNVGSGVEVSIADLAQLVCEVVGFKGRLVFDESKPDGTMRKVMDNAQMRGAGWTPSVELRAGLVRAYDFYLKGL
jgi:GDP-L-fucose synthase